MNQQSTGRSQKDQFTLIDIIKMFRGKAKFIICFALIAALLGAAAGVALSYFDKQYGTSIEFYISPSTNNQTLLQLLKSESFAEKLLLDENGLPEEWDKADPDYIAALAAIEAEKAAREDSVAAYKRLEAFSYSADPTSENEYDRFSYNEIKSKYDALVAEYTLRYEKLAAYKNAPSDTTASEESHKQHMAEAENALKEADNARNEYREKFFDPKEAERIKVNDAYNAAKIVLKEAKITTDEATEKVLEKWRSSNNVKGLISTIRSSVSYRFATVIDADSIKDPSNLNDAKDNQNYAFLEVDIVVNQDSETANMIAEGIKKKAPDFIISNVETVANTADVRCSLISTYASARDISNSSMVKNASMYAVIAALAMILLVCVVIIVKGIFSATMPEKKEETKAPQDQ